MNKKDASLSRELKRLTAGLMFQSESDYPVEPFVQASKGKQPMSAQDFVATKKTDGTVKTVEFDSFFANATQEQDWQDEDARRRVKKFQALVKFLKENLSGIEVYKVGDAESDVYVVGKTASGSLAGVTTKVVET
jgi:hypothetical protein